MKILILANSDVGLYKFRKELICELINRGNTVYIALPNGDFIPSLKKMGCRFINIDVDRRGVNPIKDIRLIRQYSYIIDKIQPEMIITYTIKPNIYGGIAALLRKKTYVINITGLGTAFQKKGLLRFCVTNMYRIALKKAKIIFFENSSNRDEFLNYHICPKNKTFVLNGAGVNTEEYSYLPYPNNDVFRFLFIGRVMKEKGVDELFESMKKLNNEYNVVLDVVGPCEENYERIIKKYESEGWLNYHGFQEDVRPFIATCDCFVLPSWHEGMANTNLECASCGRPIITSNIPGCKEAVKPLITGLLVRKKDSNDIYDKMKNMIMLSREKRLQMGIDGRLYMKEKFEKSIIVSKTIDKLFD